MESHALKQLSEEFKAKREAVGISLEQIAAKTRLDMKFLEAIEEGNFEIMPEVYMRAFIREYAQAIDIDETAALDKYDLAKAGKLKQEQKIDFEKKEEEKIDKIIDDTAVPVDDPNVHHERNVKKNFNLYYIVGGAVIVVLLILYLIFFTGSNASIITDQSYDELISEDKPRYEITNEEKNPAVLADSLKLKINANDTTWIKYIIDSSEPKEIILLPNRSKVIMASKRFELLIGNSGGIQLSLNDSELEFSGKKGEVKKIEVTSTGIQSLKTESSDIR